MCVGTFFGVMTNYTFLMFPSPIIVGSLLTSFISMAYMSLTAGVSTEENFKNYGGAASAIAGVATGTAIVGISKYTNKLGVIANLGVNSIFSYFMYKAFVAHPSTVK